LAKSNSFCIAASGLVDVNRNASVLAAHVHADII
jgi:hypothetical protein